MAFIYTVKNSKFDTILQFEVEEKIKTKNESKVVKRKMKENNVFAKTIYINFNIKKDEKIS